MSVKYTYKELKDFIYAQPDDKLVEMTECTASSSCGCLLIQFWKAKVTQPIPEINLETVGAGYSCVGELECVDENEKMKVIFLIRHLLAGRPTITFADIKSIADQINN